MKEYYRKLIRQVIEKIDDELKLHEIYVAALMAMSEEGGADNE